MFQTILTTKSVFTAAVLTLAIISSACSWVDAKPGAATVTVAQQARVASCVKVGKASAQTAHKIGFIHRGDEKIASELIALAKNEALAMGGNTLVANSEVEEGSQKFMVYQCP